MQFSGIATAIWSRYLLSIEVTPVISMDYGVTCYQTLPRFYIAVLVILLSTANVRESFRGSFVPPDYYYCGRILIILCGISASSCGYRFLAGWQANARHSESDRGLVRSASERFRLRVSEVSDRRKS